MEHSAASTDDCTDENTNMNAEEFTPSFTNNNEQQTTNNHSYASNTKRTREVDEEEVWQEVTKSRKRYARNDGNGRVPEEKVEISVTSKEPLPKQFAFARLLKINKISNVTRIRYLNAYKLLIGFETESDLSTFLDCEDIRSRGWNLQRTLEVGVSYGLIRNVELDLSEKDIMESITAAAELISVKRLNRKDDDGKGWLESETIRICFKGSSVPAYVYVYGVRTKIDTYIFPVTQCTNCWRYGHPKKTCPKKKIVCPKCTENHENCESISFSCVNCKGNHMSLNKDCPIYAKERRIREIMADFNCTYKRALTVYVPPTPPPEDCYTEYNAHDGNYESMPENTESAPPKMPRTYAAAAASHSSDNNKNKPGSNHKPKKPGDKKQKPKDDDINWEEEMNYASDTEPTEENMSKNTKSKKDTRKDDITFYELLKKLKNIILNRNITTFEKIIEGTKMIFNFLSKIVANYTPDMKFMKNILNHLWTEDH